METGIALKIRHTTEQCYAFYQWAKLHFKCMEILHRIGRFIKHIVHIYQVGWNQLSISSLRVIGRKRLSGIISFSLSKNSFGLDIWTCFYTITWVCHCIWLIIFSIEYWKHLWILHMCLLPQCIIIVQSLCTYLLVMARLYIL